MRQGVLPCMPCAQACLRPLAGASGCRGLACVVHIDARGLHNFRVR